MQGSLFGQRSSCPQSSRILRIAGATSAGFTSNELNIKNRRQYLKRVSDNVVWFISDLEMNDSTAL